MARTKRVTRDAVEILEHLFVGNDPERLLSCAEVEADAAIARLIYDLREETGLTQGQFAKRIGTTASVVDDLEMADHEGNMLGMLWRIADVLGKEVEVRVVAKQRQHKVTRKRKTA